MWDQWLESMTQQRDSSSHVEVKSSEAVVESRESTPWIKLQKSLVMMEWWRWLLVGVGVSLSCTSAILLVQAGQTSASSPNLDEQTDFIQLNSASESATAKATAQPDRKLIYVDVGGAVRQPGVHQVEQSARVGAAVAVAGGFSTTANQMYLQKYFNGAAPVHDGQKIYIPFEGEDLDQTADSSSSSTNTQDASSETSQISINTATAKQLDSLPGIGAVRAEQIISGRPYNRIEDLLERNIVTASIYSNLEELIRL